MKKTFLFILAIIIVVCFTGCAKAPSGVATATLTEDTKYGAAITSLTPDAFAALGFKLGDSCDIAFEGGSVIKDVPYYNGYYVKNGAPVIVAYPGFNDVRITYNNMGIWQTESLSDGQKVTITLNESGKYNAIQDSLGQQYSFDRAQYDSDEEFCNFRAMSGGSLKENYFYRGASPVDNSRGRAAYTDDLLEKAGVKFILDLADTDEEINEYFASDDFNSEYVKSLYDAGNVVTLGMSSSYQSETYYRKVAAGLKQMLNADGPVYIHCMEGKDRTGFVCTLIEALAGANYDELLSDYMITYKNYYDVTKTDTPAKYDAIAELYFDAFVSFPHVEPTQNLLMSANYVQDAVNYLKDAGMTDGEIEALKQFIIAD